MSRTIRPSHLSPYSNSIDIHSKHIASIKVLLPPAVGERVGRQPSTTRWRLFVVLTIPSALAHTNSSRSIASGADRSCASRSEQELAINIKKATSPEETAPKRKHVRSCIVYTWDHKSGQSFWAGLKVCVVPYLPSSIHIFTGDALGGFLGRRSYPATGIMLRGQAVAIRARGCAGAALSHGVDARVPSGRRSHIDGALNVTEQIGRTHISCTVWLECVADSLPTDSLSSPMRFKPSRL